MSFLPPRCPDCGSKMVFITVDMSDQGGPDACTWLCDRPDHACGRVIGSYEPDPHDPVCAPAEWSCTVGTHNRLVEAPTPAEAAERFVMYTLLPFGAADPNGERFGRDGLGDPSYYINVAVQLQDGSSCNIPVYPESHR